MKQFPIVHIPKVSHKEPGAPGFTIPWAMAEKAFETYNKALPGVQTLERIAERGGFEWFEFVSLYSGDVNAWSFGENESREQIRHRTQRVVADLLEELKK